MPIGVILPNRALIGEIESNTGYKKIKQIRELYEGGAFHELMKMVDWGNTLEKALVLALDKECGTRLQAAEKLFAQGKWDEAKSFLYSFANDCDFLINHDLIGDYNLKYKMQRNEFYLKFYTLRELFKNNGGNKALEIANIYDALERAVIEECIKLYPQILDFSLLIKHRIDETIDKIIDSWPAAQELIIDTGFPGGTDLEPELPDQDPSEGKQPPGEKIPIIFPLEEVKKVEPTREAKQVIQEYGLDAVEFKTFRGETAQHIHQSVLMQQLNYHVKNAQSCQAVEGICYHAACIDQVINASCMG